MPVAIEIGADLLLLCALLVLIGLSKALQYSLVALLKFIANGVRATHLPGAGWLAGHIDNGAHWLYNQIGIGVLALEHTAVWFWRNLAELAIFLGQQIKGLAYDLLWVYHRVEKFTVPYWIARLQRWVIRQIIAFAHHPVRYLRHALAEIRHDAVAVGHAVAALPARIAHEAQVREAAIAGTLEHVPPWVGKRLGTLEREVTAESRGRFTWLERLALGSLAAGVALRVLSRVAPWIRCRNVNKAGRALCGANSNLLDSLLNDLLILAGPISLAAFVHECADVAPELEDGLRFFIREAHHVGA